MSISLLPQNRSEKGLLEILIFGGIFANLLRHYFEQCYTCVSSHKHEAKYYLCLTKWEMTVLSLFCLFFFLLFGSHYYNKVIRYVIYYAFVIINSLINKTQVVPTHTDLYIYYAVSPIISYKSRAPSPVIDGPLLCLYSLDFFLYLCLQSLSNQCWGARKTKEIRIRISRLGFWVCWAIILEISTCPQFWRLYVNYILKLDILCNYV